MPTHSRWLSATVLLTERHNAEAYAALHSVDVPILRTRPLWDVVMILLLAAASTIAATRTWLTVTMVYLGLPWRDHLGNSNQKIALISGVLRTPLHNAAKKCGVSDGP